MANNWNDFYEITKNKPASDLLIRALSYIKQKDSALDLGAGALKDTRYLLGSGFKHVTAVDQEGSLIEFGNQLNDERLECVVASFNDFNYTASWYDLVNAQFSLPFNSPDTFDQVFRKINESLKSQGVFTGQLFGVHDEWNTPDRDMTFHTREQVELLFKDFNIIELEEEDAKGRLANGTPKHWHLFHIIAQRNWYPPESIV